jgi:hypothetical protein
MNVTMKRLETIYELIDDLREIPPWLYCDIQWLIWSIVDEGTKALAEAGE